MTTEELTSAVRTIPLWVKLVGVAVAIFTLGGASAVAFGDLRAVPMKVKILEELVAQHDTALSFRGPVIDSTFSLAQQNSRAITSLICLQEVQLNRKEISQCIIPTTRR